MPILCFLKTNPEEQQPQPPQHRLAFLGCHHLHSTSRAACHLLSPECLVTCHPHLVHFLRACLVSSSHLPNRTLVPRDLLEPCHSLTSNAKSQLLQAKAVEVFRHHHFLRDQAVYPSHHLAPAFPSRHRVASHSHLRAHSVATPLPSRSPACLHLDRAFLVDRHRLELVVSRLLPDTLGLPDARTVPSAARVVARIVCL